MSQWTSLSSFSRFSESLIGNKIKICPADYADRLSMCLNHQIYPLIGPYQPLPAMSINHLLAPVIVAAQLTSIESHLVQVLLSVAVVMVNELSEDSNAAAHKYSHPGCSVDALKLNHKALRAWQKSALKMMRACNVPVQSFPSIIRVQNNAAKYHYASLLKKALKSEVGVSPLLSAIPSLKDVVAVWSIYNTTLSHLNARVGVSAPSSGCTHGTAQRAGMYVELLLSFLIIVMTSSRCCPMKRGGRRWSSLATFRTGSCQSMW